MEFEVVGWPRDGPTLDLDHRSFSYAGKFVMSHTGKAVVREEGDIIAAASFNEDRTDADRMWIRYMTVRSDRRGAGIGTRLASTVRHRLLDRGYDSVRIAVNNPFSFQAFSRAGFGFTGETTGIAEVVLSSHADRIPGYRDGLELIARRSNLAQAERDFIDDRIATGPPREIDPPPDWTDRSP